MVQVTGPLHSGEARGSIGDLTYYSFRGRSYVRLKSDPPTEFSQAQLDHQARIRNAVVAWAALSDAQRLLWDNFSAAHYDLDWRGTPIHLTGVNLFTRSFVQLAVVSTTITPLLPKALFPRMYGFLSFIPGSEVGAITYSSPTQSDIGSMKSVLKLCGPLLATQKPDLRHAAIYSMEWYDTDAFSVDLVVDKWYGAWLKHYSCLSGFSSPTIYLRFQYTEMAP